MVTSAVPRSLEELTPEWLTSALRETGVIKESTIVAAPQTPIGAGAGFLGQLAKVKLEYDREEEGAPKSLIAKLPTLDPGGRMLGNLFRFYEREIRFYDDVAETCGLRSPKRYYSVLDVEGDQYLLLMQDLEPACVGDEVTGCSLQQSELAITKLAEFQSQWWESERLAKLDWMPHVNDPIQHAAQGAYQQAWGPFVEMFGQEMSPKMIAVGEEMRDKVIRLLDAVEPAPRTIIHGDYRGDNVFFGDGKSAEEFYAIDWQISSKGRGVFDVAYFLSTSLDPVVRKAEEMRLLRTWHEIIVDGGAKGYTFDDALRDYRTSVLFMHVYTVIALGTMDMANERGKRLFHEWLRRRTTAIEELDAGEMMPK